MTNTFRGNETVPSGYYLNLSRLAIEPVAQEGGRLPAGPGTWKRIPTLAAVLATPVVGLAFLMFLPLVGFVLTARAAATPALRLVTGSAGDLAATVSPGWQPGEAHFTGKHDQGAADEDERLDALQREIDQRRAGR